MMRSTHNKLGCHGCRTPLLEHRLAAKQPRGDAPHFERESGGKEHRAFPKQIGGQDSAIHIDEERAFVAWDR